MPLDVATAQTRLTADTTQHDRAIRAARQEKRWKQKQLAAAVHVEPLTVSRWERGQHMPDLDTLGLVAKATGKDLSYFIGEAAAQSDGPAGAWDAVFAKLDEVLARLAQLEAAVSKLQAG